MQMKVRAATVLVAVSALAAVTAAPANAAVVDLNSKVYDGRPGNADAKKKWSGSFKWGWAAGKIGSRDMKDATVTDSLADGWCIRVRTVWSNNRHSDSDYSPWACGKGTKVTFDETAGGESGGPPKFTPSNVKIYVQKVKKS